MIQSFPDEFFEEFQVIINGLDNVEARRWVNQKCHELCIENSDGEKEADTIIIDGGTEGFQGQARVIIPY